MAAPIATLSFVMDLVSLGSECLKEPGGTPTRVRHLNKEDGLECILNQWFIRLSMTYPAELTREGFSSADVNAVI